ncbi:NACHT domain-containing protein [Tardiphaga sp. 604_B6_N1_1]|uniref:NACHT domain-containing protein n=1 Tax=Tardiphaga sp. 604_B6_N1_1 TaxID=3240779 RepID=UPI003F20B94B
MDGIDLGRLNPTAFERLIRALCFASMGPAGTVYSSGPDGGRDFTYEGKIPGYEGRGWDGYLVVQAKFKDPSIAGVDDNAWLERHMTKEYQKYLANGSSHRRPEYYILITNVRLSGSDGLAKKKTGAKRRGGHTKALDLFSPWKTKLKVKDVDIWSHDKIVDLLARYPDIRQTYAQWITSGDVLARALEHFTSTRKDFGEVASRWLRSSLVRDQYVRLKDAGSVGDPQIRTSQVIVDLPLIGFEDHLRHIHGYRPTDDDGVQNIPANAIARLVDRAREKLDADTLLDDDDRPEAEDKGPSRNRIVLMGGPGQGKSTASLFLAQIFRATILKHQQSTRRDPDAKALVPEILKRAEGEGISTSIPARFPLHILLPRFADVISAARSSGDRPPSLLSYIASEIAGVSDQEIDRSDLRNWLRHYPWLLVLDGLDEVPPTGERPAILDSISAFFTEVSEVNADILVVVTTRPQGYNKDLDEKLWDHWRLADLGTTQALNYAKAFGEARYPDDSTRRIDIQRALEKAAAQPATARLMVSPLQVTILHFIVDTGGGVPTARWTLFNEYFEVLKKREKAKGGELQKFLERNWNQLGPIHHRAGLILQVDSEHAGGAGSRFTQERFRRLVTAYLTSEGFAGEDLATRVAELMQLALNRLVLLSQQIEGTISFDVRSLQEFMAAAAITSDDQRVMEARLSHIAGISHWRHVFLIAASRCFADDGFLYRRAVVTQIARQIDASEPDMTAKNGARLALDLLADGVALDHPNFRRPLLIHALEQLDLGLHAFDDRLAVVFDEQTRDLVEVETEKRIREINSDASFSAWSLLFGLSQAGNSWADNQIERLWPVAKNVHTELINALRYPLKSQRLLNIVADTIAQLGPVFGVTTGYSFSHSMDMQERREQVDHGRLRKLNFGRYYEGDHSRSRSRCLLFQGEFKREHSVPFSPLRPSERLLKYSGPDFAGDIWLSLRKSQDFASTPNKQSLADAVRAHKSNMSDAISRISPWPLAAIIAEARDAEHLELIAQEVERGLRGDINDWQKAEKRWKTQGVLEVDFTSLVPERFFGADIGHVGIPFWVDYDPPVRNGIEMALKLGELSGAVKNATAANIMRKTAAFMTVYSSREIWPADKVIPALEMLGRADVSFQLPDVVSHIPVQSRKRRDVLSLLLKVSAVDYPIHTANVRDTLLDALILFPDLEEVIYPLMSIVVAHEVDVNAVLLQLQTHIPHFDKLQNSDAQLAAAIFQLMVCAEPDVDASVQFLTDRLQRRRLPYTFLNGDTLEVQRRLKILALLVRKLKEKQSAQWREFISPMRRALDARRSGFVKRSVWVDELSLPAESFSLLLSEGEVSQ